jgi:ribosomal protein S18 acetylase RimI-like enzyme
LEQGLKLIEIPASDISHKVDSLADYRDSFPGITGPSFLRNIRKAFLIHDNGTEKGLVFSHRLTGDRSSVANHDYSILVYSEHQRKGIGRTVVELLIAQDSDAVFLVPESNEASLAFFRSQAALIETETGNLFVFIPNT